MVVNPGGTVGPGSGTAGSPGGGWLVVSVDLKQVVAAVTIGEVPMVRQVEHKPLVVVVGIHHPSVTSPTLILVIVEQRQISDPDWVVLLG